MCLTHMELREEMYCQLMKQTAKRVHVLSESASALEVMYKDEINYDCLDVVWQISDKSCFGLAFSCPTFGMAVCVQDKFRCIRCNN